MSKAGIALGLPAHLEGQIIDLIAKQRLSLEVVRRVLDTTEALAVAQAGLVHVLVLDALSFEIDAQTLLELKRHHTPLVVTSNPDDETFFHSLGVEKVISAHSGAHASNEPDLAQRIVDAVCELVFPPLPEPTQGIPPSNTALPPAEPAPLLPTKRGHVVAVWGTSGAPGRSTTALNLAAGLSSFGQVLLIDADTHAPSLQQMLGIAPGISSLLSATRLAGASRLEPDTLWELTQNVGAQVQLLGGINKAGRWREVAPEAAQSMLDVARERWDWTVVDVGSALPLDSEVSAPRQVGDSTRAVLQVADVVLLLGLADPVGMRRLLTLLPLVEQIPLLGKPLVVVNRVRASVAGSDPCRAVRQLAAEQMPGWEVALLRDDHELVDRAVLAATNVETVDPKAHLTQDFNTLTQMVRTALGYPPLRRRSKTGTGVRK